MLYLLDTNVLRSLMDQDARVVARISAVAPAHRTAINTIVAGEARFGVERLPPGTRRDAVEQKVRMVLASILTEPVPVAAAEHYARVKRAREASGTPMDENDLWIAATALALGAVLVTRDTDFLGIPSLALEDWTV